MSSVTPRDLEDLYVRRHSAFRNALIGIAGGIEAGDDAVQEGFARALAGIDGFRGDGTLEAWVWRICINQARDQRRRPTAEALDDHLGSEMAWPERDPELWAALRRLPERRRLVVFLRYFADLSYQESATVTGMRVGTVAATLNKAHTSLRDALEVRTRG